MSVYTILRTGLEGPKGKDEDAGKTRYLPDNIYDAIRLFKDSEFSQKLYGEGVHAKFAELMALSADRCPRALGATVKTNEVQFHHEITNQYLWSQF